MMEFLVDDAIIISDEGGGGTLVHTILISLERFSPPRHMSHSTVV